jgi:hypothetical protein
MSEKVRQGLLKLFKGKTPVQVFVAKVISVSLTDFTCDVDPIDDGATYYHVRLKPTIDGDDNGIICVPKENSYVLVGILGNNENAAFILSCSLDEYVLIKANNGAYIKIHENGNIVMNGGGLNGMVKVADLVTRMNTIEQDLNAIKAAFAAWVPVPNDGGAALKTAATAWAAQALALTTQVMLENTKVKHG